MVGGSPLPGPPATSPPTERTTPVRAAPSTVNNSTGSRSTPVSTSASIVRRCRPPFVAVTRRHPDRHDALEGHRHQLPGGLAVDGRVGAHRLDRPPAPPPAQWPRSPSRPSRSQTSTQGAASSAGAAAMNMLVVGEAPIDLLLGGLEALEPGRQVLAAGQRSASLRRGQAAAAGGRATVRPVHVGYAVPSAPSRGGGRSRPDQPDRERVELAPATRSHRLDHGRGPLRPPCTAAANGAGLLLGPVLGPRRPAARAAGRAGRGRWGTGRRSGRPGEGRPVGVAGRHPHGDAGLRRSGQEGTPSPGRPAVVVDLLARPQGSSRSSASSSRRAPGVDLLPERPQLAACRSPGRRRTPGARRTAGRCSRSRASLAVRRRGQRRDQRADRDPVVAQATAASATHGSATSVTGAR